MASTSNARSAPSGYDMYDFSGVSSDLAILRSQLFTTLNISEPPKAKMDTQDDEEWYPPSPPIYDVTDKLIEVNREFYNDPTSTCHLAGKVRWKPDENLVQIKWLYSSASERSFCYQQSESEEESSDENNEGLAAHLAREMKFFPPKIELTTIEDLSPDNSEQHTITLIEPPPIHFRNLPDEPDFEDYDDEDFEEPSLAEAEMKSPLLRDDDIVSQMETIEMSSVSSNSSNSESCKTTKTSLKKSSATENNNNVEVRPSSRPRTKTTVIRTHNEIVQKRSSSMPKTTSSQNSSISVSNSRTGGTTRTSSSHARIKIAHSNNNNNSSQSCSSSGEEGSSSSSGNPSRRSSIPPGRSSSLQPKTRKVITSVSESRPPPKTTPKAKSSVYITNGPGLNGVPARPAFLHRKNSRNSLSSNSSVSSQTTEDGSSNSSLLSSRGSRIHRHPITMADVISPNENPYFAQWKLRKREEKKLRARKSFLEQQMRRPKF